jgi:hypothetical protein
LATACLGLLAIVVFPALAGTKSDNERVVCFNNLRLIGRGIAAWGGDHQQRVPWRVPLLQEGGTMANPKPGNAWFEFCVMSNTLVTPKILACPSDVGVKVATNFSQYISAGFRQNSTSYAINLDLFPENYDAWVTSDRNVRTDGSGACSSGINPVDSILPFPSSNLAWTNAIHGANAGHLLIQDGSVRFTDTAELRKTMQRFDENGNIHLLKAR